MDDEVSVIAARGIPDLLAGGTASVDLDGLPHARRGSFASGQHPPMCSVSGSPEGLRPSQR